jgi:hypothetical protein
MNNNNMVDNDKRAANVQPMIGVAGVTPEV